MCGRYYVSSEEDMAEMDRIIEEIERRLRAAPERLSIKSGEIFPTDVVPAIAESRRLEIGPFPMKWGYTKPGGGVIINARSETVFEKPMFRSGVLTRRCLIPASYYFEWEKTGSRRKYAIRPGGTGLMYMAGIYRYEQDKSLPRFVILTRPAARSVSFIHDRMPVILPEETRTLWLEGGGDLREIINAPVEELRCEAV